MTRSGKVRRRFGDACLRVGSGHCQEVRLNGSDLLHEMANPEGDGQYCRQQRPQQQRHGSVRIEFGARVETKSSQFQIEASPGETQVPRRFGDVAGRPIERGLNELAFDLFDGRRQVRVRAKRP